MTKRRVNGQSVVVTWPQIWAFILLLAGVIGSWYDMRTQIAVLRQEFTIRITAKNEEHQKLWEAMDRMQKELDVYVHRTPPTSK